MTMSKSLDKKKHILMTAMKMFAVKSYRQTTMQEIADVCEMSKGSLYLYFKSKEELLLNIFEYYFQMFEDQCVLVERDPQLSSREKFVKFIDIHLNHAIAYEEFNNMQMHEINRVGSKDIDRFIREKNAQFIRWIENYLLDLYGDEIKPYCTDCILILNGITMIYIKAITIEGLPLEIERLSRFILRQLDYVVEGLKKDKGEPMIANDLWDVLQDVDEEMQHPLVLIKQMKDRLAQLPREEGTEEALQSLAILERELVELEPRQAILSGMLRNLAEIDAIAEMCVTLGRVMKMPHVVTGER